MKKSADSQATAVEESSSPLSDLLASIEKAVSAVARQVKRIRAKDREGDAMGVHAAIKDLRESLRGLEKLAMNVEKQETLYSDRADRQFLELESAIREACGTRGWRVDGQWPTLYVERAIALEVSGAKRAVNVAGTKLPAATAETVVVVLESLVRELLPKGFSPKTFMSDLAAAYDSVRGNSTQLPVFELYRSLVLQSQRARFWRDARADTFTSLSADQFRARLTAMLERGVTSSPDGRALRLLPPLNPKDGLFMYQPAELRFGFVGRVEFVPSARSAAS